VVVALGLCSVAAVGAGPANAQTKVAQAAPIQTPVVKTPQRSDLETAAATFERCANSDKNSERRDACRVQAGIIRARLAQGDFQPGHRILLFVAGDSALSDTFTVRSDQKLQLPNLPEIKLAGVLNSELQGYLQTQLAQYIRNPAVRAQALLRVSVSGDVGSPGFYSLPIDTPVSDVIMTAGGPTASADMSKSELRRGNTVVVKRAGLQEAFRSELTMSDIGARPGDELYVPGKPTGNRWQKTAAIVTAVSGIAWTLVFIANR
jgi:polysaccharide export outer membrane protein